MTGDQHIEQIQTGQRVIRHADRPNVFYFFSTAQNILKFCQRTIGTFASRTSQRTTAKQSRVHLKIIITRVNQSLQKSQFTHPPLYENDRLKNEKSYIGRQKLY